MSIKTERVSPKPIAGSSIDTLAKRILEKGGSIDMKYCRGNATKLNYWVINMSLPSPFDGGIHEKMVIGGLDEPLIRVATKANGAVT